MEESVFEAKDLGTQVQSLEKIDLKKDDKATQEANKKSSGAGSSKNRSTGIGDAPEKIGEDEGSLAAEVNVNAAIEETIHGKHNHVSRRWNKPLEEGVGSNEEENVSRPKWHYGPKDWNNKSTSQNNRKVWLNPKWTDNKKDPNNKQRSQEAQMQNISDQCVNLGIDGKLNEIQGTKDKLLEPENAINMESKRGSNGTEYSEGRRKFEKNTKKEKSLGICRLGQEKEKFKNRRGENSLGRGKASFHLIKKLAREKKKRIGKKKMGAVEGTSKSNSKTEGTSKSNSKTAKKKNYQSRETGGSNDRPEKLRRLNKHKRLWGSIGFIVGSEQANRCTW